jgi:glycerol uptake facilitator-like aquaporin
MLAGILKPTGTMFEKWLYEPRPRVISKFFAEFIACSMFHFIGSVAGTAFGNGIALMVLVYYSAKTSGAHLNPALSLSFFLLGYINPLELIVYWIAQIMGTAFGALWLALLVPGLDIREKITRGGSDVTYYDGCFVPVEGLSYKQAFGWEALCTFNFLVPIFSVVWYTLRKKGYGNTGPFMIGLSLMVNALVAGPFTGAALNPARVLGSMIVFDCPARIFAFYYIMGELLAGALVPLLIMPWYGIAQDAWYLPWVPISIKRRMKMYQASLRISADDPIVQDLERKSGGDASN